MRKTGRKARREGMSAGRVEYIEAARRRARNRRLRRTAVLVALVAAVVIYLTGIVNTSVMVLEDLTDSARIALSPRQGFPQQTGAGDVYQAESLGGSFVVLGAEGCAVFAEGGARLNTVGAGYARPALAAGKGLKLEKHRRQTQCPSISTSRCKRRTCKSRTPGGLQSGI